MRYQKILVIVMSIFVSTTSSGQFTDSFADGDFIISPEWTGDLSKFQVVEGRLKLQGPPVAGTSYLATTSQAIYEAEWEFSLQLDFTPSSANYAKVFLVSDHQSLTASLNGYFIKIGNTTREVSLYRQTGTSEVEIIDGLDDRINQPVVVLRVRATRDSKGTWSLFSDAGQTGGFVLEGSVPDNTHSLSGWFGVQCVYTATRSDKFWFDNFVVTGSAVPDLEPPTMLGVEAPDSRHVVIHFSEGIHSTGLVQVNGIGMPAESEFADSATLICTFDRPLENGLQYSMVCQDFEDFSGNRMPPTETTVRYFVPGKPTTKAVLITEIFADPTPQVGLPAYEFIEIYNPGSEPFELHNWRLTDGSSTATFPSRVMLPGMFVVVTSTAGADAFGNVNVIALTNFPSLNNSGDNLLLSNETGMPIDSVNYTDSWYGDEDKVAGGWSLELIDPVNPCGQSENWIASENEKGGTPGATNSVLANKPDLTPPQIVSVRALDSVHVSIVFNELLHGSAIKEVRVELIPPIGVALLALAPSIRGLELTLEEPLQFRTAYEIRLTGIRDCNGNEMESTSANFGLAEPSDSLDVFLSEVLFNPRSGGVDFVEVFNGSKKYIDMEGWVLSNGESETIVPSLQLAPQEWLALTTDPDLLRSQYVTGPIMESELPSLPDEEGTIILRTLDGKLLDRLAYSEKFHSQLLQSTEGVSLERIDFSTSSENQANWVSAVSASGFATPGLPNSNGRVAKVAEAQVVIVPEVFAPGVSSLAFVQIQYHFDQPGFVSNVRIYDRRGISIKELAANETLGTDGFLRWDGDRDNGTRAPAGYYFVWFESFDLSGRVETFRRRVVIAAP